MDLYYLSELRRYEKYLRLKCNTHINKYVYQSHLINNNVQFYVKSACFQDRLYSSRDLSDYNSIRDYVAFTFGVSSILESLRINNSYSHRVSRLRKKISKILESPCLFITFTFTDDVLLRTSYLTRRRYVQRFLKSYSNSYVGNVDYGEDNGREHYHAIINCSYVDNLDWSYGAINFEKIKPSSNSLTLSKYIAKLTNHAVKQTTKRLALIYPKSKK